VAFALWETLEQRRLHMVPREGIEGQYLELEGAPDCVVEIGSESSVRKDTRPLRQGYYRAGIPEYWLIDPRRQDITFRILVRGESDYEETSSRSDWQASRILGRHFRLVRRRGRLDLWEYTLQVKPLR